MELNLPSSGCKCRTLFHGSTRSGRSQNLKKQLQTLVHYICHCRSPPPPCKVVTSVSDLDSIIKLLENEDCQVMRGFALAVIEHTQSFGQNIECRESLDMYTIETPVLNVAIGLGMDVDIIKKLLIHGADPCKPDTRGMTPLHQAVRYEGTIEIVKELMRLGADANASCYFGETPLHLAVKTTGNSEVIKELLKHGADVNRAEILDKGNTPLGLAALYNKSIKTVRTLLRGGADADITNRAGKTPLAIAVCTFFKFYGPLEVIEELLKHTTSVLNAKTCNRLLKWVIWNEKFCKVLIKCTLLNFKGDYYKLFELHLYKTCSNYAILSHYLEDCIQEIVQMESLKIRNGLSLLSLVTTKNVNAALYPNSNGIELIAVKENLTANYPVYGEVISPKVKYAVERATLLNELKDMHAYMNRCSLTEDVGKVLISDCSYIFAKYLFNEDLHNFMLAFRNFH